MDHEIEKIINKAGRNNKYQFIVSFIFFILYGAGEYLTIILPLLQAKPIVTFKDEDGITHTSVLNYTICENYPSFDIKTDHYVSLITELKIHCDRTLIILTTFLLFLGAAVGSVLTYNISDNYGRKTTLLLSTIILAILQIPLYWMYDLTFFYIWFFIYGMVYTSITVTTLVYVIEMVRKSHIAIFCSIIFSSHSFTGIICTIFFMKFQNHWRFIFFVMIFVYLLLIPSTYYYIDESPAFHYAQGNFEKFFESVMRIAGRNGKMLIDKDFRLSLGEKSTDVKSISNDSSNPFTSKINSSDINNEKIEKNYLKESEEILDIKSSLLDQYKTYFIESHNKKLMSEFSLIDLIRYDSQRIYFLILCYMFLSLAIIFNGLSINIKNLNGNIFVNSIIVFSLDIIVTISVGFISNTVFFGRKTTLTLLLLISFCSYMTCIFAVNHPEESLCTYSLFTSRTCMVSLLCVLCFYSNEIYPTVLRTKGLGVNYALFKFGGAIAPFVIEKMSTENLLLVFCILNLFALLVSFILPETIKRPMRNQIDFKSEKNDELLW